MANEIRLRLNNLSGTITDNPLTSGATTINSPQFSTLPVVDATNHLILILDPLGVSGAPEIVKVTAHTSLATSVTVQRAQEGSLARSFVFNTTWYHGPTVADWNYTDRLALSTNRPLSPFAGQMIYETDTKKLQVYNGTDWNPNQAGGQLGYAQAVADQGTITTVVDLTSLTVTVTVGTGRRIKISGECMAFSSVADDIARLNIQEGATVLQLRQNICRVVGGADAIYASVIVSPTAGSHTYKLTMLRAVGTGNITMNAGAIFPAYILVEDIGAA